MSKKANWVIYWVHDMFSRIQNYLLSNNFSKTKLPLAVILAIVFDNLYHRFSFSVLIFFFILVLKYTPVLFDLFVANSDLITYSFPPRWPRSRWLFRQYYGNVMVDTMMIITVDGGFAAKWREIEGNGRT